MVTTWILYQEQAPDVHQHVKLVEALRSARPAQQGKLSVTQFVYLVQAMSTYLVIHVLNVAQTVSLVPLTCAVNAMKKLI